MVSDPAGEPLSIRIVCGGRTLETSQLELGLWESADGQASLAALLDEFAREWEVAPEELLAALERLWRARSLRLLDTPFAPPVHSLENAVTRS